MSQTITEWCEFSFEILRETRHMKGINDIYESLLHVCKHRKAGDIDAIDDYKYQMAVAYISGVLNTIDVIVISEYFDEYMQVLERNGVLK